MKILTLLIVQFILASVTCQEDSIKDVISKVMGLNPLEQNLTNKPESRAVFQLTTLEGVSFGKEVLFKLIDLTKLGKGFPYIQLISNLVDFFVDGFGNNELSVWDQVREKVIREIEKKISDYHKSTVLVKLRSIDSDIKHLKDVQEFTPWKLGDELLALEKKMYSERSFFNPFNFNSSTTYEPSIILSMTKFAAYYLSVSRMIENFFMQNSTTTTEAELNLLNRKQGIFWDEMRQSVFDNIIWSLDEREKKLEMEQVGSNYFTKDSLTGLINTCDKWESGYGILVPGAYAVLARQVRIEAYKYLTDVLIDPINKFLEFQSLPKVTEFVDEKKYPLTIYGYPCNSPCTLNGDTYWCGYTKYGNSYSWDYCSPVSKDQKETLTIKEAPCFDTCKEKSEGSYFYCNIDSDNNWDYCSPLKTKTASQPKFKISETIHDNYRCIDECAQRGKSYYWCNVEDNFGKSWWDYCSPNRGQTYLGEDCKGQCSPIQNHVNGHTYSFACDTATSWDYCSSVYLTALNDSVLEKFDLYKNDHWFDVYGIVRDYYYSRVEFEKNEKISSCPLIELYTKSFWEHVVEAIKGEW